MALGNRRVNEGPGREASASETAIADRADSQVLILVQPIAAFSHQPLGERWRAALLPRC
jgi:hypothetical protein